MFKDRDGQTPLPENLQKGLKHKQIQNLSELDEYEEKNISLGILWLNQSNANELDVQFGIKLHQKLFGEVWSWAGKIREHELNNLSFTHPPYIKNELVLLSQDTEYRINEPSFVFKECMAIFHEKVERIHPFSNGNGRWGRILTEYICQKQNQTIPRWGQCHTNDPTLRRDAYIKSLRKAQFQHNFKHLIEFMYT